MCEQEETLLFDSSHGQQIKPGDLYNFIIQTLHITHFVLSHSVTDSTHSNTFKGEREGIGAFSTGFYSGFGC